MDEEDCHVLAPPRRRTPVRAERCPPGGVCLTLPAVTRPVGLTLLSDETDGLLVRGQELHVNTVCSAFIPQQLVPQCSTYGGTMRLLGLRYTALLT